MNHMTGWDYLRKSVPLYDDLLERRQEKTVDNLRPLNALLEDADLATCDPRPFESGALVNVGILVRSADQSCTDLSRQLRLVADAIDAWVELRNRKEADNA